MSTRRQFSREFKIEAVKLVRERSVSVAQAARDLDVHKGRWGLLARLRCMSITRVCRHLLQRLLPVGLDRFTHEVGIELVG